MEAKFSKCPVEIYVVTADEGDHNEIGIRAFDLGYSRFKFIGWTKGNVLFTYYLSSRSGNIVFGQLIGYSWPNIIVSN